MNEFDITWELQKNGAVIKKGILSTLNIAPDVKQIVSILFSKKFNTGAEYFSNLSANNKSSTSWVQQGHIIAIEQFALNEQSIAPSVDKFKIRNIRTNEEGNKLFIKGDDFETVFDKEIGTNGFFKI